jgi:truncated hemoglobin YjbI/CDGSH-type Zn-finger protein
MDEIVRAVRDCPSGALSLAFDGSERRDLVDRPREPGIEVTKDGPYRITGSVGLVSDLGADVARNDGASREHFSLCRCGRSRNKPFCSGMHWYADFHDPVPDPDAVPTLFAWAGGLPVLLRMTRLFYEKYLPDDPLVRPLFAAMAPDHPLRVARWLGEVFGGPRAYSETADTSAGGYFRMLSHHVDKKITEEQRARWVHLMVRSADGAGVPNDAEFRAAFVGYLEWGSRLAVENSQTDSQPPRHMPMPRWDWGTAGPPGGRVSALAPRPSTARSVTVPGPDEQPSFAAHIRGLFRDTDRRSMQWAFDLGSHSDVATHGPAILTRLRDGSMPCDGRWPPEWIAAFERWLAAGAPA